MGDKSGNQRIYPYLCGGAFLTLVLRACRRTPPRDFLDKQRADFHEEDVIYDFGRIVNQSIYQAPDGNTASTQASYFKNCHQYTPKEFQFDDEAITDGFKFRLNGDGQKGFIHKTWKIINAYVDIDSQKGLYLARQLIELIRDDADVPVNYPFLVSIFSETKTKSELENLREIHLPAFLLSVWAFVIIERNKTNPQGKLTLDTWKNNEFRGLGRSIETLTTISCESPELPSDENTSEVSDGKTFSNEEEVTESVVNDEDEAAADTNNHEENTENINPQQNQFILQNGVFFQQNGANSKQFFGNIENLTIN